MDEAVVFRFPYSRDTYWASVGSCMCSWIVFCRANADDENSARSHSSALDPKAIRHAASAALPSYLGLRVTKRAIPKEIVLAIRGLKLLFLAPGFLLILACRTPTKGPVGVERSNIPSVPHYRLNGLIIDKSLSRVEFTVSHEPVEGLMPAMTMSYKVEDPAAVEDVQVGDRITAELFVVNGDYILKRVVVTAQPVSDFAQTVTPPHFLKPGDSVPDVPMTNQDGKPVNLRQNRGKALLVTFIYSRCPLPNACPRVTTKFSRVNQELLSDADFAEKTHLLSITLDPDYDKPSVLRQYGLAYMDNKALGFEHWDFAACTPANLRKLANAFGMGYTVEDNQITHSLETILIGPSGKVAKVWYGSDWTPEEVVESMRIASSVSGG